MKMVALNTAIGMPRSAVSQISAMDPPTLVMGAELAIPAIMRPASMVAIPLLCIPARHEGRVKMK